jgi:sorting nexin-29
MSEEWQTAIICPILKKGNKLGCENYRGISLLNVAYKIFTDILAQRIKVYTEEILGEYQGGFRQGRSTTDHIFITRQILEKSHEYISSPQLYIDFKQAYDSIDWSQIIESVKESGIPAKLIYLLRKWPCQGHTEKLKSRINFQEVLEQNVVSDKEIPYPHCCLILA